MARRKTLKCWIPEFPVFNYIFINFFILNWYDWRILSLIWVQICDEPSGYGWRGTCSTSVVPGWSKKKVVRIIIDPGIPQNAVPSLFRRLNYRRVVSVVFILSFILPWINWYKLWIIPGTIFLCVDSLENRDGIFSGAVWRWLWVVVRGAPFRAGDAPFFKVNVLGALLAMKLL